MSAAFRGLMLFGAQREETPAPRKKDVGASSSGVEAPSLNPPRLPSLHYSTPAAGWPEGGASSFFGPEAARASAAAEAARRGGLTPSLVYDSRGFGRDDEDDAEGDDVDGDNDEYTTSGGVWSGQPSRPIGSGGGGTGVTISQKSPAPARKRKAPAPPAAKKQTAGGEAFCAGNVSEVNAGPVDSAAVLDELKAAKRKGPGGAMAKGGGFSAREAQGLERDDIDDYGSSSCSELSDGDDDDPDDDDDDDDDDSSSSETSWGGEGGNGAFGNLFGSEDGDDGMRAAAAVPPPPGQGGGGVKRARLKKITPPGGAGVGGRKRRVRPCFGCMWDGAGALEIDGQHMSNCARIIDTHLGWCDLVTLARTVHLYFKENVWRPGLPMWRTREIYRHILHIDDPTVFLLLQIKALKEDLGVAHSKIYRQFTTDEGEIVFEPNLAASRHRDMVLKDILLLYSQKPQQMNFYREDRGVRNAGGYFTPFKNYVRGAAPGGYSRLTRDSSAAAAPQAPSPKRRRRDARQAAAPEGNTPALPASPATSSAEKRLRQMTLV